jgi:SMI1-KNR4 cell-wall
MNDMLIKVIDRGPVIGTEEIKTFKARFGLNLPEDYERFLLTVNGGRPLRDLSDVVSFPRSPLARIHYFYGIGYPGTYDLEENFVACAGSLPPGTLAIACTEGPDLICLHTAGSDSGAVFFWDYYREQGEEGVYPIARSFGEFAGALYRDEGSPAFE